MFFHKVFFTKDEKVIMIRRAIEKIQDDISLDNIIKKF
jgi:hypothetical protein